MGFLEALILGVIEGITEFLPVSSTAHLILTNSLLNVQQTDFVKSFEIAIQLGAILSVVYLYWRDLFINREILKRVIAAFIPTAIIAFVFYVTGIIKGVFFESNTIIVTALIIGGAGLIIFELMHKESETALDELATIPYSKCLMLGLCQSVAIIPGVSRSAATIVGGLLLGLKRKSIVEFSFLLAVPTMLSATALDLIKTGGSFTSYQFFLLAVGFCVSFIVALLSIKFLLNYIRTNSFISFGVYRIAVGIALIGFFALR
jgi:undecaprenyl-diphosphatase